MERLESESFTDYKKRRTAFNKSLKKYLKGKFIHISKHTLSRKEKGITYRKES